MPVRNLLPAVAAIFVALARIASAADRDGATSLLDHLSPDLNSVVTKTREGVAITTKDNKLGAIVRTEQQFKVPLVITVEGKTDSNNLRVHFGKGRLIFNWESNQNEMKFNDPRTGKEIGISGKGKVPVNTWVTIRWIIGADETRVEVDGEERYSTKGDYGGLSSKVGIGTYRAVAVYRSLTVMPIAPPLPKEPQPPRAAIDLAVPSKGAVSLAKLPQSAPPNDFRDIERPEFQNNPKRLMKNLTGVTSMMVIVGEDGQQNGLTSDIIATVPAESRNSQKAGVGFVRADGDSTMRTALEEALRAVTLRYPYWEAGHLDLSFGEKFVMHGGPSAGTAFGLLMLSALEGWDIDRKCAITGDISVDWKVRKVGGVTAKLRGAALDKCLYAAIPAENETAFTDMGVLYGNSAFYDLQVFSIATLQDAVAIARTDRPDKLAEAIKLFDELRLELAKSEKQTLARAQTRETLKRILELAPNHLSARRLLSVADGTAPRTLSVNGTSYQLSVIFYPYQAVLSSGKKLDRFSLPPYVTAMARKRLGTLRPMANKELQPLLTDMAAFIEAMDSFAAGRSTASAVLDKAQNLDARFAALGSDPAFVAKMVREGY